MDIKELTALREEQTVLPFEVGTSLVRVRQPLNYQPQLVEEVRYIFLYDPLTGGVEKRLTSGATKRPDSHLGAIEV